MTRLGIRLALAGGRGAAAGLILTSLAVALGTAILLFALSFRPALDARFERAAWRQPIPAGEPPAGAAITLLRAAEDRFAGRRIVTMLIAAADDGAPVPPGIPAIPAPGTSYLSPALRALLATTSADQLGARFGTVVGTIGDEALRAPDELVAILGSDATTLEDLGAMPIWTFDGAPRLPDVPELLLIVIPIAVAGALAPVAVFVATATRLSAARREQRLAALRLVGATSRQIVGLAVVESLLATIPGAIGGIALFSLTRPLVALVPLDEAGWFPDTITPPLGPAMLLIALVPVIGAIATVVALRRVVVTPLGVRQRTTPKRPGIARLAPVVISSVALLGMMGLWRADAGEVPLAMALAGLAFAGIIVGLAVAGPWLTWVVGSLLLRLSRGASMLLAARRLTDDPRGSFGAIAGVVMAVFVAAAFFTVSAYIAAVGGGGDALMRPGQVLVQLPYGAGGAAGDIEARIQATEGVTAVLPVREAELFAGGSPVTTWIVACPELVAAVDAAGVTCDHPVMTESGWLEPGTSHLTPDRGPVRGAARGGFDVTVSADDIGTFEPAELVSGWLPEILVDPSFLSGDANEVGLSRLYVSTDGDPATMERVRTAAVASIQGAIVRSTADRASGIPMYAEFGRVVSLGLIGTMVLAGCSLSVAVTTGMLDRRRQLALLRSAGMPVSRLRQVVLLQAGAPLIAVAIASALLGIVLMQALLYLVDAPVVPLPSIDLPVTLGLSLVGAMVLVAMTLPALERLTRPEVMRLE